MNLKTYVQDSYKELVEKVSWPTWKELQSSAIVVLVATVIIALIVLAMDKAFQFSMNDIIYQLF